VTTIEQVSGQSWGQAPRLVVAPLMVLVVVIATSPVFPAASVVAEVEGPQ
jgi:hypothetical protein